MVKRKKQSKPARHTNAAPFACVGELKLCIERNPAPEFLQCDVVIVERCMGCGQIVDARAVLDQVNNDDEDDCA